MFNISDVFIVLISLYSLFMGLHKENLTGKLFLFTWVIQKCLLLRTTSFVRFV